MFSRISLGANRVLTHPLLTRSMSVKTTFLQCDEFGPPEKVLRIRSTELKAPADNEVLVKVLVSPINPADINIIQGKYGISPPLPFTPGNECVAEVLECGKSVSNLRIGDRVFPAVTNAGTWQTHTIFKADDLFKVPAGVSNVDAATITVNPSTAFRMLRDFVPLKAGDTVIQNGANSAVGQAVIQLCKIWNVNSVNVVRDRPDIDELKQRLKSIGATEVLTEEEIRVTTLFRSKQLPAPKLALNCVGGKSATNILRHLDDKGQLVTYGAMSREPLTIPTGSLIFKDIAFRGYWMTLWKNSHSKEEYEQMCGELFQLMADGKFKAAAHKLIPIDQYKEAMVQLTDLKGMTGQKILFDFTQ